MNLRHLKAVYFRNLKSISLDPRPGLNLFIGDNGQGKTNLLDAIAMGAQLKPIRPVKQNSDLILFGEREARIEAQFEPDLSVTVHIDLDGKKVRINNKPTRDSFALREKIALVSFVPEDLSAIMGSAGLRRRLLDQITASLYPNYALYYRQYEKVLLQRNRLLKQPLVDLVELDSFSQVLAQSAHSIEQARILALGHIRPYYEEAVFKLSDGQLTSVFEYNPSSLGDLKASLEKIRSEERARKTTLLGPHLDDLDILLNQHPARFSASRGQARILILALKIAQLQAVFAHRALSPVLLLDDIVGELDPHNALRLLQVVDQLKTQTFITTTHLSTLPTNWQAGQVFSIKNGQASKV
ncbi:MAG: DNA replication and repair protein RecF [Myxococcaceae bacterium]